MIMGKVTIVAAVVLGLLAATPLQAREDGDDAAPTASDDIMDGAITCVAAYDSILASGDDSDDVSAIAGARAAAIDLYAQISGESRDQISHDIRQADADLPAELAGEGDTLDSYAATCDAAFMDVRHDLDDEELIA